MIYLERTTHGRQAAIMSFVDEERALDELVSGDCDAVVRQLAREQMFTDEAHGGWIDDEGGRWTVMTFEIALARRDRWDAITRAILEERQIP